MGARISEEQRKHIGALDGLRGVAIIGVIFVHFTFSNYSRAHGLLKPIALFAQNGWIGVPLFFALSGYLITGILLDSLGDSHFFKRFYARRTLRIFPVYYFMLFGLIAVSAVMGWRWTFPPWVFLLYLTNYLALHVAAHVGPWLDIGHLWTLAVEEQFYMVWPLCVFLLRKKSRLLSVTALLIIVSVALRWFLTEQGVAAGTVRFNTACELDSLLLGAFAAQLMRSRFRHLAMGAAPWLFAITSVGLALEYMYGGHFDYLQSPGFLIWGFLLIAVWCASLTLWTTIPGSAPSVVFSPLPFKWLGRYSYGIYLYHGMLVPVVYPLRVWVLSKVTNKVVGVAAPLLILSAASILVAVLSFHLLEKPFLRLKRYFNYDRGTAPRLGTPSDEAAAVS